MFIIQRWNGKYWLGDPDRDNFGHYSDFDKAQKAFDNWTKVQSDSTWRLVYRVIHDATLTQYEPE